MFSHETHKLKRLTRLLDGCQRLFAKAVGAPFIESFLVTIFI